LTIDIQALLDLAKQVQESSSKPIDIVFESREEVDAKVAANPYDLPYAFYLAWDSGRGVHRSQLSNDLWPEWKPKKAVDVLKPMLQ
jgi:hypothetical protein